MKRIAMLCLAAVLAVVCGCEKKSASDLPPERANVDVPPSSISNWHDNGILADQAQVSDATQKALQVAPAGGTTPTGTPTSGPSATSEPSGPATAPSSAPTP